MDNENEFITPEVHEDKRRRRTEFMFDDNAMPMTHLKLYWRRLYVCGRRAFSVSLCRTM